MAIILDRQAHDALAKQLGRRMRAARISAKVSEQEAADLLGHRNATQISLAEKGERVPPLLSLVALADHYGVSLDYLAGRIDDPVADPIETNQVAIKRSVVNSIEGAVNHFFDAVSALTSATVSQHTRDRAEMRCIVSRAEDLRAAYTSVKSLNPGFDDDVRGGSRLEAAINGLCDVAKRASERIEVEDKAIEVRRAEVHIDVEKFCLTAPPSC